jgi:hypothetical protein
MIHYSPTTAILPIRRAAPLPFDSSASASALRVQLWLSTIRACPDGLQSPRAKPCPSTPRAKEATAQAVLSPEVIDCPVIATVFDAQGRVKKEAGHARTRRNSSKTRT